MTTPPIDGVLETALYVRDLDRSVAFFTDILGRSLLMRNARMAALDAGRRSVLLLFVAGQSAEDMRHPVARSPAMTAAVGCTWRSRSPPPITIHGIAT